MEVSDSASTASGKNLSYETSGWNDSSSNEETRSGCLKAAAAAAAATSSSSTNAHAHNGSNDFQVPAAAAAAPAATTANGLPLWSKDPNVNLVCVHLILKADQEKDDSSTMDPQHMTMMALVQTLLDHLPKLREARNPQEVLELVKDDKAKFLMLGMSQAMAGKTALVGTSVTNTTVTTACTTTASYMGSQYSGKVSPSSEDSPSSDSDEEMKKRSSKILQRPFEMASNTTTSSTDSHSAERRSFNSEDSRSSENDEDMKKRPNKRPKQESQQSAVLGQESLTSSGDDDQKMPAKRSRVGPPTVSAATSSVEQNPAGLGLLSALQQQSGVSKQESLTSNSSDEETKMPAKKRPHPAEEEEEERPSCKFASASVSVGASVPSAAATLPQSETSMEDDDDDDDDDDSVTSTSPHALLAALSQHLDILAARGQTSSTIPAFLRDVAKDTLAWEKVRDKNVNSTSSTIAVRTVKRKGKITNRDQYYQDLVAQCLEHWKPPMPVSVSFPDNWVEQDMAQAAKEQAADDNCSQLSESVCPSSDGSSPTTSDYESSTGESNDTSGSDVPGRIVRFAPDASSCEVHPRPE